MIPGVNITSRKASIASINGAGVSGGALSPSVEVLGFKEHLDWLKIDLNATEIITVQDYKCTKNHVNGSTNIQFKAKSQVGSI